MGSRKRVRGGLGCLLVAGLFLGSSWGQLSLESYWPKHQRDLQNSGFVDRVGFAADIHVHWALELEDPLPYGSERHATPVFAPGNSRLYVGGRGSTLRAVDVSGPTVAWTLVLGDGTGVIQHAAAVGADGSIYVGAWDGSSPYDGFCKVRDDGAGASVVWTFPVREMLAGPTITPGGLIVVGGRHEVLDWGYYALRDLGDTYEVAWMAGQVENPSQPGRNYRVGSTPAISLDGSSVFGAGDRSKRFWQIDAASGAVLAEHELAAYCWASGAAVSDLGEVFIGEGMTLSDPDEENEGKVYAFEPDEGGVVVPRDALALGQGHLNGGVGALRRGAGGGLRLYVPANGFGADGAALVAVDFDPEVEEEEPALGVAWTYGIGGASASYPMALVTDDAIAYVLGPVSHTVYAVRDGGEVRSLCWSVSLADISRVEEWAGSNVRGPQGVVVGPDGTIYWNAADGYLYALRGWVTGDLNGDGVFDDSDMGLWVQALSDPETFALYYPEVDALKLGDLNLNGRLDSFDLNQLVLLLSEG